MASRTALSRTAAAVLGVALVCTLLAGARPAVAVEGPVRVLPVVEGGVDARWDPIAGATSYTVTATGSEGGSSTFACVACGYARLDTAGFAGPVTVTVVGNGPGNSVVGELTSAPLTLGVELEQLAPVNLTAAQRPGDQVVDVTWDPHPQGYAPDTYTVESYLWQVATARWVLKLRAVYKVPDDPEAAVVPVATGRWYIAVRSANSAGGSGAARSQAFEVVNPCGGNDTCIDVGGAANQPTIDRRGQGFLAGTWGPLATLDVLAVRALDVKNWRVGSANAGNLADDVGTDHVTQVMSDLWYAQTKDANGGYMQAPWTDWAMYRVFVRKIVLRAQRDGWTPSYWDIWNEPDFLCCPKMSPADTAGATTELILQTFEEAWRAIKSVDPAAKVTGPSLAGLKLSPGTERSMLDLRTFLEFSHERGLVWDAITWHETYMGRRVTGDMSFNPGNIPAHVDAVRQMLLEFPGVVPSGQITINEYTHPEDHLLAGWTVGYFKAFEDAGTDAMKSCYFNECKVASPAGLLGVIGLDRRAVYWAHRFYADMANQSRVDVRSSFSWQTDGLASRHDATSTMRVLLGRHGSCNRPVNPTCTQWFVNPPSRTVVRVAWAYGTGPVRVVAKRLPAGTGHVPSPPIMVDTLLAPVDGIVTVDLGQVTDGDAVTITLTRA